MKKELIKPIIFYIILFLFFLAFSTTVTNYDYDLWARLIAGMGFVQTGHVLKQDFLSYTPTHTWFDHEWGSGVIFYLTQHFFASAGLLILQAILTFALFFVITRVVKLRGVKTTSAYNFLFYYFAFSSISYIIEAPVRCQMFSFLFFAVFIYILELARKDSDKPLWLLPVLMIFWNNIHGGCVSGIGLIVIYIVGEFFNRKPIKKYIYPLIATILVLPINPWGFEYIKFLLTASTMPRPEIVEWWGLFSKFFMFKYMKFKIFAFVMILVELGVVLRQIISKKFYFDKTKFLVLAVTIYLAVQHVKLIPLAVIAISCFLYDDFYTVFNFITRNIFNKMRMRKNPKNYSFLRFFKSDLGSARTNTSCGIAGGIGASRTREIARKIPNFSASSIAKVKDSIIYCLILIFAISNINAKAFGPLLDWSRYPVLSVEFVKINQIKGNLLVSFGLGSYASYKLYPNNKIFIDGRYEEVYYDGMLPLLNKFYRVRPGWDEVLKKYPPDVMIIEKFYPVSKVLESSKEWKAVFEDNFFLVFVKSKNAKKTYKKPSLDIDYYKKTIFDTNINFMLQSKHESNK